MTATTFLAPYAPFFLVRKRRQAPVPSRSADNLDAEAIKAALAKFNSQYGISNVHNQVTNPSAPVAVEPMEAGQDYDFTVLINVLKKVFNGTYELTKFDLMNGEIVFKIFIKVSTVNRTWQQEYANFAHTGYCLQCPVSRMHVQVHCMWCGPCPSLHYIWAFF